jgi:hypothetical protein
MRVIICLLPVDDITARIRCLTQDLRAIEGQLRRVTFSNPTPEQMRIVDELLSAGLLLEFKSSVDHIRQFLWAYIEGAASSGHDLTTAIQGLRLQRVTEMLRVLREDMDDPSLAAVPGSRSFFEEINTIAHKTMDLAQDSQHDSKKQ